MPIQIRATDGAASTSAHPTAAAPYIAPSANGSPSVASAVTAEAR